MNFALLFNQSFEANVNRHYDKFIDRFYDNFMASSPEVRAIFAGSDVQRQKEMMDTSLLNLVDFTIHRAASPALKHLASVHLRRGVSAEMYDFWMEALIKTLTELDKDFDNDKAVAWRVTLAPGIEFMKHYREN